MTGFARAEGHADGHGWVWEVKSVNGRGLDLRCRVPPGLDRLEAVARAAAQARFKRGTLALTLTVSRPPGEGRFVVNRQALEQIMALRAELGADVDPAKPRLEELLAVNGVVSFEAAAEDEAAAERRLDAMVETLETVLDGLADMRGAEGARLHAVLVAQLDTLARLADQAAASAASQPAALKERLQRQVAELLEAEVGLSEERLVQETAILAAKADVREEIDRLVAHIAAARDLIAEGRAERGAVGRRLDFLCQELNREANTIAAKAADLELTRTSLALKAAIEQFREQVQNIE